MMVNKRNEYRHAKYDTCGAKKQVCIKSRGDKGDRVRHKTPTYVLYSPLASRLDDEGGLKPLGIQELPSIASLRR